MRPFYGLKLNLWAYTRPRIKRLHYTGGGLGDELMFTAVAAEAARQGRPLHVLTDFAAVWNGNRDVSSVQTGVARWFWAKDVGPVPTGITHLSAESGNHVHLADQMAQVVGVELPDNWAPVYRPRLPSRIEGDPVVIQNSCRGARYAAVTKEWPFDRWDQLAQHLIARGHKLIQIGTLQDPVVKGVVDLRGKTELPRAAAILEQAKLFIGLESGLMHLAAAVRVPSVIIYGGRTRPWETGYPWHWQLANTAMSCAGCALNTGCPYDVKCMDDISVDLVLEAVGKALSGERSPGFTGRLAESGGNRR